MVPTETVDLETGTARRWAAEVVVLSKPSVNDPEGEAIRNGLRSLGHAGVERVRAGRVFRLELRADDAASATAQLTTMCEQLLANPVIETFELRGVAALDGPPLDDRSGSIA
jgi:phosphoribosylformylglycinamidine synthase PurS subunit